MKKLCLILLLNCNLIATSRAQSVEAKLEQQVERLLRDEQMKYAIFALQVIEAGTGKVIYQHNANTGLAPASTQKIITSASAFDILGPGYQYETALYHDGRVDDAGALRGNLFFVGSGDPTLGSSRWKETSPERFITAVKQSMLKSNITSTSGAALHLVNAGYTSKSNPDGWIWQDVGNYYGAYPSFINWQENQFEIRFNPGATKGDTVGIASLSPAYVRHQLDLRELLTGARGSGDSAYVYFIPGHDGRLLVAGSVPATEKNFAIKAAHPDPPDFFNSFLQSHAASPDSVLTGFAGAVRVNGFDKTGKTLVHLHRSPPLDSINYWFMRRSVNLFGEALLRTIALNVTGTGSTEKGVQALNNFWKKQGIEPGAMHILDGSGLSPQNRITAAALVQVLRYAKSRPWYKSFYTALPEINRMKMKSGSILGARAYAGYHTSRAGKEYIFAIMVNNYEGSSSMIVRKMWGVLDVLK